MTSVLLIGGPRKGRPETPDSLVPELARLAERKGEMIAAVGEDGKLAGTLGLFPDRDEGGRFYHLAGLQVEPGLPGADTDVLLMEAAGRYLASKKTTRLKFGTSPLLTHSAWLYVNRFGARYRWREGTHTPRGQPWPYVSCECDYDDPQARPLDLLEDEVMARSLLTWDGGAPVRRTSLKFAGPLCVALPDLDADGLAALARDPAAIGTLHAAFQALHVHGYEFAWFDRLAAPGTGGTARWYYLMKRVVSL